MVRRPGFLLFVAPGSHSPLQSPVRCGRIGGMDDRANRVVARPPIGSLNDQPIYLPRDIEAEAFMAIINRRDGWMDKPLGEVGITALLMVCAIAVCASVMACPVS